jgi:hypothetical protein
MITSNVFWFPTIIDFSIKPTWLNTRTERLPGTFRENFPFASVTVPILEFFTFTLTSVTGSCWAVRTTPEMFTDCALKLLAQSEDRTTIMKKRYLLELPAWQNDGNELGMVYIFVSLVSRRRPAADL